MKLSGNNQGHAEFIWSIAKYILIIITASRLGMLSLVEISAGVSILSMHGPYQHKSLNSNLLSVLSIDMLSMNEMVLTAN